MLTPDRSAASTGPAASSIVGQGAHGRSPWAEGERLIATILIADDLTSVRRLLRLTLDGQHTVLEAEDGGAALELLRRCRPDVAVLDVAMPVLSGLQVCQQLRSDPDLRDIGVIIISASATEDDARLAGADCFIAKPFLPSALLRAIDGLVRVAAAPQTDHAVLLGV